MDKAQLYGEIAKLEMEIKQHERTAASSNQSAVVGAVGALLGVVLLFVVWPIGIVLVIAGGLAWITQASKRGDARKALAEAESKLAQLKGQLAAAG